MGTTRREHLEWCKARAREYLDRGDATNAIASMMSDMRKRGDTSKASTSRPSEQEDRTVSETPRDLKIRIRERRGRVREQNWGHGQWTEYQVVEGRKIVGRYETAKQAECVIAAMREAEKRP